MIRFVHGKGVFEGQHSHLFRSDDEISDEGADGEVVEVVVQEGGSGGWCGGGAVVQQARAQQGGGVRAQRGQREGGHGLQGAVGEGPPLAEALVHLGVSCQGDPSLVTFNISSWFMWELETGNWEPSLGILL